MCRVEGDTLRLPEQEAFSIALPQTSEKAGLDGTAEADADATQAGTAAAAAAVTNSGTVLGSFQLGHAFKNDVERQTDFDFDLRFHYEFEIAATPETSYPDAQVGLKLYARGSRGRLLRDLTLFEHSTENGSTVRKSDETLHFTVTLGPGEAVNVFLAGQVRIEIREGRSARGSLKLSDLRMDVTTRPAPAVKSSDDEQP